MPSRPQPDLHPDFAALTDSWDLALQADGYSESTLRNYARALLSLARWLGQHHPDVGPADTTRDHIRGWIVDVRNAASSSTARAYFAGVRHFFRWAVAEGEATADPTDGIRTPAPNDQTTPVLTLDQVRALLATCTGSDFTARRDAAIIFCFIDCGLRLSEVGKLTVDDVHLRERMLMVRGKGSNRSGPRLRAVPFSVKAARAIDRYLRERRKHPHADRPELWLGARDRPPVSVDGVERMLHRRAGEAGFRIHAHQMRHTWASESRAAGLSEGDLMALGGWSNRAMLDRYGKAAAADRAQEAYRRLALGDRL